MKLPIGKDNFKKIREGAFTFVDKSLFIEEVWQQPAETLLITRPRRFGKTLNQSMLAHFLDQNSDSKALFKGLAIEARPCFDQLNQWPVIFLSFKDLKATSYETFLGLYRILLAELFVDHLYLRDGLNRYEQVSFDTLAEEADDEATLVSGLARLVKMMANHHNKKVVLLIDEYDSPLQEAYAAGYHQDILTFMRASLGKALKGNDDLEKAVLTGILRVSKESIFSDLNNIQVFTVLNQTFADKFGFTEREVRDLLEIGSMEPHFEQVQRWYNGYQIGNSITYNPWSVINFLYNPEEGFQPYWVNTGGNLLVRDQVLHSDLGTQRNLIRLLQGENLKTEVEQQTVFQDLDRDGKTLWSLLLFSGYLTVADQELEGSRHLYYLRVPNQEVLLFLQDVIQGWLRRHAGEKTMPKLMQAMITGDMTTFEKGLETLIKTSLSYFDTKGSSEECVYHAFVLGLLAHSGDRYQVRSNRESGHGRYDVMMIPKLPSDPGFVLEFKVAKSREALAEALAVGIQQIKQQAYATELKAVGVTDIREIAIAFHGKHVAVAVG